MKQFITLVSLLFSAAAFSQDPCSTGRYASEIFSTATVTSNVQYGNNTSANGQSTNLFMDIYEPTGDTETARPLIIWAHGGSFIGGSKGDQDVATLSEKFAKRGYVCASIDYRLGFFPIDSANAVRAVVRAVQDMKASVRYFYKDRATTNTYKIDTTKIYIGGSSAGAITSLHVAYLDKECELQDYLNASQIAQLGGLDGASGNPGYSQTVHGVINLCGALAKYSWLEAGDIPLCSVHGTNDNTVKYNRGIVNPGVPLMYLDGSRMLTDQTAAVGVTEQFYTFNGAPHVPYFGTSASNIAYMDTTVNFVRDFLIDQLGCSNPALQPENTPFGTANLYATDDCLNAVGELNTVAFTVAPNPTNGEVYISGNSVVSAWQLVDVSGKILQQGSGIQTYSFQVDLSNYNSGMYLLNIQLNDGVNTSKRIIKR